MLRNRIIKTIALPFPQRLLQNIPFKRELITRLISKGLSSTVHAQLNGFEVQLELKEQIQRSVFLGSYEPEQTSWIKKCLKPGDIFVDVGPILAITPR